MNCLMIANNGNTIQNDQTYNSGWIPLGWIKHLSKHDYLSMKQSQSCFNDINGH